MSDDIAIQVENLSKRYVISHQRQGGDGLRHALQDKLSAPFRRLRNQSVHPSPDTARSHLHRSTSEDFWALKDVSLEIKRGAVVGIIGRNGAGKSTLLKILSRITEPTTGRITIEGRIASLLEVGTGFHPELTGRENIFLNGAILGMSRAEIRARFDEIVAFAEVEQFLDTPVKRYSSGMYVRLAFAVSAHLQTDILIVDEVLAVGDAEFQKKCLGKMQEVASGQGRTVLFVSHQLAAIRRLCTTGCLLRNGKTDGLTTVEEAITEYSANLHESPFDLDLATARRNEGHGRTARILRVRIPSESALKYGEPLTLVFSVECPSRLRNAVIGMGFDTLDGYRILTLDSDNSSPPLDLGPGRHQVRFDLERNPLNPGVYSYSAAILAGKAVIDAIPNCAVWEVLPSPQSIYHDRGFSGCRLPVSVTVLDASSPVKQST